MRWWFAAFCMALGAVLLLQLGRQDAHALIDVQFTPKDMVRSAVSIAEVKLTPKPNADTMAVEVVRLVKGPPPKIENIHVTGMVGDVDVDYYMEQESLEGMLFMGDFSRGKQLDPQPIGVLHIDINWYSLVPGEGGKTDLKPDKGGGYWDVTAVWDSGHSQLVRLTDYVLANPEPHVPIRAAVSWDRVADLSQVKGQVGRLVALSLPTGRVLAVPADEGDLLIGLGKDQQTVTKLPSRSRVLIALDIDGDKKHELLGTDGEALYQVGEQKSVLLTGLEDCRDLVPVVVTGQGPAVVAFSPTGVSQLSPAKDGKWERKELPWTDDRGAIRVGTVVDATEDGHADVLAVSDTQIWLAPGGADGGFEFREAGEAYEIDAQRLSPADFDGDGRLDLLITGTQGSQLMVGQRDGTFVERIEAAGELPYHSKALDGGTMVDSGVCDLNNDGLLDIWMLPPEGSPITFYNRGYGTFGLGRMLDLGLPDIEKSLPEVDKFKQSKQAGAFVDVDGDGAQDLVAVTEGAVRCLFRKPGRRSLGVTFLLPPGAAGPRTVHVQGAGRQVCSIAVFPGQPVFLGRTTRGPYRLTWQDGKRGTVKQMVPVVRTRSVMLSR